jgi:NADPH:quinone reductase-like Zn-dependent oxidoreductase
MKTLMVSLVLAATAGTVRAQVAHSAFVAHPHITRADLAASRFWTPGTIALVVLDGAAKAADSFATRRNLDAGGKEDNPLARPFVHTPPVQVTATAALFGAEIATAYLLHRRHHDKLGRAVLVLGATMNGLGAAYSVKHR